MAEVGADLDALAEEGDAKAEGRKPGEKRQDRVPAKPVKPAEGGTKPPEDGTKPPESGTKPPEGGTKEPEPEPKGLVETRTAYQTLKKKFKEEYEPKLQQVQKLEAKVKELETANPPEMKALQERLEAAEKRNAQLEGDIEFIDFSKSAKFEKEYKLPYRQAWAAALADLEELTVEDEAGNTRKAGEKDLLELANLPLGAARKKANAMFGESADDVMAHRRKVIDLANAQNRALEEARNNATERATTAESTRKANSEKTIKMWTEANAAIVQKWPKMFAPVEGDAEGNALLQKGEAMADRLFSPTDETKPKTPEDAIRLHALIRNKIRNHDRLALWLKNANAKIKELETTLAQYESSEPNGGQGGGPGKGGTKSYMQEAEDEIDELARKA